MFTKGASNWLEGIIAAGLHFDSFGASLAVLLASCIVAG